MYWWCCELVTPCSIVVEYQSFEGPRCLHLLHGFTAQKNQTRIFIAVKNSNLERSLILILMGFLFSTVV